MDAQFCFNDAQFYFNDSDVTETVKGHSAQSNESLNCNDLRPSPVNKAKSTGIP